MIENQIHEGHSHQHGPNCGHTAVRHEGHVDYLHDGHMHHQRGDQVLEHAFAVSAANPQSCMAGHECGGHESGHVHGANCGHQAVPHGDHSDYLVGGHLHNAHNGHCDDHGQVEMA